MGPYWQEEQLLYFPPREDIARLAMRALSYIIGLSGDETIGFQHDCHICIEEFKNKELIQPFGVCIHEQ